MSEENKLNEKRLLNFDNQNNLNSIIENSFEPYIDIAKDIDERSKKIRDYFENLQKCSEEELKNKKLYIPKLDSLIEQCEIKVKDTSKLVSKSHIDDVKDLSKQMGEIDKQTKKFRNLILTTLKEKETKLPNNLQKIVDGWQKPNNLKFETDYEFKDESSSIEETTNLNAEQEFNSSSLDKMQSFDKKIFGFDLNISPLRPSSVSYSNISSEINEQKSSKNNNSNLINSESLDNSNINSRSSAQDETIIDQQVIELDKFFSPVNSKSTDKIISSNKITNKFDSKNNELQSKILREDSTENMDFLLDIEMSPLHDPSRKISLNNLNDKSKIINKPNKNLNDSKNEANAGEISKTEVSDNDRNLDATPKSKSTFKHFSAKSKLFSSAKKRIKRFRHYKSGESPFYIEPISEREYSLLKDNIRRVVDLKSLNTSIQQLNAFLQDKIFLDSKKDNENELDKENIELKTIKFSFEEISSSSNLIENAFQVVLVLLKTTRLRLEVINGEQIYCVDKKAPLTNKRNNI